jgi:hypothetical protein
MTALFIVRAEKDSGDREAFDRWYEQEHLPQAAAAFKAVRAWRELVQVLGGPPQGEDPTVWMPNLRASRLTLLLER